MAALLVAWLLHRRCCLFLIKSLDVKVCCIEHAAEQYGLAGKGQDRLRVCVSHRKHDNWTSPASQASASSWCVWHQRHGDDCCSSFGDYGDGITPIDTSRWDVRLPNTHHYMLPQHKRRGGGAASGHRAGHREPRQGRHVGGMRGHAKPGRGRPPTTQTPNSRYRRDQR